MNQEKQRIEVENKKIDKIIIEYKKVLTIMSKIFHILIEFICWVLIMLSPTLVTSLIAVFLFLKYDNTNLLYIIIIGVILGIFFAESVRRKIGCATYLGRILATPDIWPTDKENK